MMLFWAWVLLAFDIFALIPLFFVISSVDDFHIVKLIHIFNTRCIPFIFSRFIWVYRIYKYWHLFQKDGVFMLHNPLEIICAFEILCSFLTIVLFVFFIPGFISKYLQSLEYGKRCSLNLFLKTYKILDYSADGHNLMYRYEDISFSFIPYLIAGEIIYQKKSCSKKRKTKESQKELYSMMIKDLQKIQKEEEAKAAEYFSTAEKTAKNIQETLDMRHSL